MAGFGHHHAYDITGIYSSSALILYELANLSSDSNFTNYSVFRFQIRNIVFAYRVHSLRIYIKFSHHVTNVSPRRCDITANVALYHLNVIHVFVPINQCVTNTISRCNKKFTEIHHTRNLHPQLHDTWQLWSQKLTSHSVITQLQAMYHTEGTHQYKMMYMVEDVYAPSQSYM